MLTKTQEYHKKRYQEKKEEIKANSSNYYEKNKVEKNLKQKEYYEKNKDLIKERNKTYSLNNLENEKLYQRKYYQDNKEKIKKKSKEYNSQNKSKKKEYSKKYAILNKDLIREKNKNYVLLNKDKANFYAKEYIINRKKTDPLYKLIINTRGLILNSIKRGGYKKTSRTYKILGCSFEEFKIHIENLFTNGMCWDNRSEWHLDHIYPVSRSKDENHLIELNHYTNFQPLWAGDNIRKGNRLTKKINNDKLQEN